MKKLKVKSILAALLACAMLAGCSSAPSSSSGSSSTPESKTSSSEAAGGEAVDGVVYDEQGHFLRYDPPITLTTNTIVYAGDTFHEGQDIYNNHWLSWMEEKLGIKWEIPVSLS